MTTYAEIVKDFYRKSGLGVKDYAEAIGYSTTQLSNILNDSQPGSMKAVQACLRHAHLGIEDLLCPPDEPADSVEEKRLLRAFRTLNAERRALVLGVIGMIADAQRQRKRE